MESIMSPTKGTVCGRKRSEVTSGPPTGSSSGVLTCSFCELQVFVGNVDNDSTKTNMFDPPVVAQFLRIVPVVCRRACTLRMELVGCELNGKHGERLQEAAEMGLTPLQGGLTGFCF